MCRCVGKIIAKDLRLVASRLYETGFARPRTCLVQPCRYNDLQKRDDHTGIKTNPTGSNHPTGSGGRKHLGAHSPAENHSWRLINNHK